MHATRFDSRLVKLEDSDNIAPSPPASKLLSDDELAIFIRNHTRAMARHTIKNEQTLEKFFDVYGTDEPSCVDLKNMKFDTWDDLKELGITPQDLVLEALYSGVTSAISRERFLNMLPDEQRSRYLKNKDIDDGLGISGGAVAEMDRNEFTSYQSRHSGSSKGVQT